jgi:hypothetical protein
MVYDEGFDFSFGEQNGKDYSSYFVFSKYGKNDNSNSEVKSTWASYCYATLIGWYQVGDKHGCFYGTKTGQKADKVTNGEATNKQVVTQGSMKEKVFLQTSEIKPREEFRFTESKFTERLQLTSEFKDHAKAVERINASNLSWKAAVYSEFEGKTIAELNKMSGRKKSREGSYANFHIKNEDEEEGNYSYSQGLDNTYSYKNKVRFTTKQSNKNKLRKNKKGKKQKEFPRDFDWREFMGPAKSQVSIILFMF